MKVVVVEDSLPVQRLLVRRLVGARLEVTGTAVGADEAVKLVLESQPDVVVLDKGSALEAALGHQLKRGSQHLGSEPLLLDKAKR